MVKRFGESNKGGYYTMGRIGEWLKKTWGLDLGLEDYPLGFLRLEDYGRCDIAVQKLHKEHILALFEEFIKSRPSKEEFGEVMDGVALFPEMLYLMTSRDFLPNEDNYTTEVEYTRYGNCPTVSKWTKGEVIFDNSMMIMVKRKDTGKLFANGDEVEIRHEQEDK